MQMAGMIHDIENKLTTLESYKSEPKFGDTAKSTFIGSKKRNTRNSSPGMVETEKAYISS